MQLDGSGLWPEIQKSSSSTSKVREIQDLQRDRQKMSVQKCINGLLLIHFLFMVIVTPLIDIGHILTWYANNKNGDAPSSIKIPQFAVVFILFEHLIVWPLCIANLYGIFKGKSWVKKTCLIYGVVATTAMAAILSEMIRSSGASSTLSSIYVPFLGFALISTLNGLVPHC